MTCRQLSEFLSGYVDAELAPEERREVERHLAMCGSCREQAASLRSLRHAIARLPSREELPGAVRARVEALRFGRWRPFSSRRAAGILAAALAAGVIVAAVTIRSGRAESSRLAEELVRDHLRWQADPTAAQVVSDDPGRIAGFFEGLVPFAPIAPRLPEARLTGGRLCRIAGRRAQLLFYTCERRNLSLFILDLDAADGRCLETHGRSVCSRRFGRLTALAVGEIPGHVLEQLLGDAKL